MIGLLVPERDTPEYITVMRFTHDGMPVNSIAVPDVDAVIVPEVMVPLMEPLTVKVAPVDCVAVPIMTALLELATNTSAVVAPELPTPRRTVPSGVEG